MRSSVDSTARNSSVQCCSQLIPKLFPLWRIIWPPEVCIFADQSLHTPWHLVVHRQRFQHHGYDEVPSFFDAFLPCDLQFEFTPCALQEIFTENNDGFPAGFDCFQNVFLDSFTWNEVSVMYAESETRLVDCINFTISHVDILVQFISNPTSIVFVIWNKSVVFICCVGFLKFLISFPVGDEPQTEELHVPFVTV